MCRAVAEFQDKSGKPVVASMSSLAASGGYYVAAPCRWIVAHELTITGSIGVVMHGYNYRGLMDKLGLRPEVYKSGKFKDMMGGDREQEEILPEERQMLQALINEAHGRFKEVIAKGRQQANQKNQGSGRKLTDKWLDFTDGRVLSGRQAHELGFVDELGSFQTAVQRAKKLRNLGRANLIQYQQPFNLANLFRLFAKSEPRSIKVDIGADLPRLQAGRLYFLFDPDCAEAGRSGIKGLAEIQGRQEQLPGGSPPAKPPDALPGLLLWLDAADSNTGNDNDNRAKALTEITFPKTVCCRARTGAGGGSG